MKKIIAILILLFLNNNTLATAKSIYKCELNDFRPNGNTKMSSIKSWMPNPIMFTVHNNDALFYLNNKKYPADLKINDDKKLEFISLRSVKSKTGQLATMRYLVTFFKTNNKFTVTASPSGYQSLGDAWGICNVSFDNSTQKSTSNLNNINEDWSTIRRSGSTDLLINATENALLIKSGNKVFYKIFDKLKTNPNLDIRYCFMWQNEKRRTYKYEYCNTKVDKAKIKEDGLIKMIMLEGNNFDKMLTNEKEFLYFYLTDYSSGTWFATRTVKIN